MKKRSHRFTALLARHLPAILAGAWAFLALSAFALECERLLHANLVSATVDFSKVEKANPTNGGERQVQLFAAPTGNGFFASNGKSLGYVETGTGKFEPILDPKGNVYINVDDGEDFLSGQFYLHRPLSAEKRKAFLAEAARTGADTQQIPDEIAMNQAFFVDKRTRKAVYSPKFSKGALVDNEWSKSGARFYPYVEKDAIYFFDIRSGEIRKLSFPFVPTQIVTIGSANAVALLHPGIPPIFVDATTGKVFSIKGLGRLKMPDAKNPGSGYTIFTQGKAVFFRESLSFGLDGTKPLKEFAVDLEARAARPLKRWNENYVFQESHAEGALEISFNLDVISRGAGDAAEDSARVEAARNAQQILVDTFTGKPLFEPANWFEVVDGPGQSMIQRNFVAANQSRGSTIHLFDVPSRTVKEIAVPKEFRVLQCGYDLKRENWIVSFYPIRTIPGNTALPSVGIYSREGKLLETIPIGSDLLSFDDRGRFVGYLSRQWKDGKTYLGLEIPETAAVAKAPAESWAKAGPRLGAPLSKHEASAAYPELLAYFEGQVFRSQPKTAAGAFLNLFSVSNIRAGHFLAQYPELVALLRKYPADLGTRSTRNRSALKSAIDRLLRAFQSGGSVREGNTAYFTALRPFLERTPKGKIEEIVDTITEGFKNQVMREALPLADVFESKVYKTVRHSFSENFGLNEKPLTDLTVAQANDELTLLAVGSHGIEGGTKTRFGIDYREIRKYPVPSDVKPDTLIADTEVSWIHNGEKFTAKVVAKTSHRTMDDIVKFTEAPDYARLLKDKKLTTAVVTGSNLFSDSADVLGEYLQAFKDRGYKFEKDVHIPDLYAFLQEKLSSGEIDLFIKEAHSDGDEKNLFRIFKTSELKVGRKKLPNGEEEVVYLVYPSPGATGSEANETTKLISNSEFGEWMRAREKSDVPLYYLNSSCWSNTKAKAEIQAAASPALVEIPSLTTMSEFTYEPGSVMYETVMGLLDRRTFDELEERMLKDPSTAGGQDNILLWPSVSGKEKYVEKVLSGFKQPIDIQVQVFDSKGRPYHFDEQH